MKWTPKKTTIVIYALAFVVDIGLAVTVNADTFPISTETAAILQKVFIAVGVVLVLGYVRAIDSKEDSKQTDASTVTPTCQKCSFPLEAEAKFCIYCNAPVDSTV